MFDMFQNHCNNVIIVGLFFFNSKTHIFLKLHDTYHPRFVTEVVNRVQRVNAWQSSVLQPNHHVAMVSILVHAEGVLSDQHKVWLEGPGT